MLLGCLLRLGNQAAAAVFADPGLEQDELAAVGTAAVGARGGRRRPAAANGDDDQVQRDGDEKGDRGPKGRREVQQDHDKCHCPFEALPRTSCSS